MTFLVLSAFEWSCAQLSGLSVFLFSEDGDKLDIFSKGETQELFTYDSSKETQCRVQSTFIQPAENDTQEIFIMNDGSSAQTLEFSIVQYDARHIEPSLTYLNQIRI